MSLNFWSSLIWQVLFLSALYRWGNNFREERQTFWGRIKIPHYPGFQRHEGQEDSSETLRKRYGALDYEWGENSGRNVTDIVSRSSKPWSLQNWSCIHVCPLHSTYHKTCIYNILKQWPKAWPLWQNQNKVVIGTVTFSKGGTFPSFGAMKTEPWLTVGQDDIQQFLLCLDEHEHREEKKFTI